MNDPTRARAVLVTGCSSGIGLEIALTFARRGEATYATMRDPARARRLLERAGAEDLRLQVLALDVTDDASVAAAVAAVERRHGAVDVLVNNAGIADSGPVETLADARARAVLETNLWGPVRTIRAALPAMRARGAGAVINVGSVAARVPAMPFNGFYAASKCALGALSESLSWELAPFGIRVVCVEPGFVTTEISHKAWGSGCAPAGPYAADHEWVNRFFVGNGEATAAEPAAVAEAVVAAAEDPDAPLHLLVGADAESFVSLATDVGGHEGWVAATSALLESVAGPRPTRAGPAVRSALARS